MKALTAIGFVICLVFTACIKEGQAPVPDFTFFPESGSRFNIFYFDASLSFDPDNSVYSLKYRWDFNGDGIFDTDFSNIPTASYKFPEIKCYQVNLEISDPEGHVSENSKQICLNNNNNAPFPAFAIVPPIASLGTEVRLDASRCFDYEEAPEKLLIRWDFNGDKNWDTEFSNQKIVLRQFNQPGYYSISMEIIDSDGASAELTKVLEVANTYNRYDYITDFRDGKVYGIVEIGKQWIMAQNLIYGTFVKNYITPLNNGICEVFAYQDEEENLNNFGGLYLWDEVLDYTDQEGGKGFCPEGWHLPSDQEWKELEISLGIEYNLVDSIGWERGLGLASQLLKNGLSGFEAGLWGFRYPYRIFSDYGSETHFWSSTMEEDGSVWVRGLSNWSTGVFRGRMRNNYALAVRCFKD
ncbi:MAG: hypothetical protein HOD37_11635 [Bacteroidetes bacterium]|nr:hypothetical protein [Bacteroidota bacterium]